MILVSILEIFEYKMRAFDQTTAYTKWHVFELSELRQTIYSDEVQNQLNKDIVLECQRRRRNVTSETKSTYYRVIYLVNV